MCQRPSALRDALQQLIGGLVPDEMSPAHAAALLGRLAEIARLADGGVLLVAARAAESDVWLKAGFRSPAEWIAELMRRGLGDANRTLQTAERITELDATADALRRGELSGPQAQTIADAATKNPRAEGGLLRSAETGTLKELQDRAREAKAAAASERSKADREEQIRRARYLRTWTDEEGAFRLDARLTAEAGSSVLSALEAKAKDSFDEARAEGEHESSAAYLADALVDLCTTGVTSGSAKPGRKAGGARRPPVLVHLRVDLAALVRGGLSDGELCEMVGVGPCSLATATNLIGDSFVKLFVRSGVDVLNVVHYGRTIPAHVLSALEERDPHCVVPGCRVTHNLEIDHWQVPFAKGGPAALWNLARLCTHHHRLKTHRGWRLLGGPGKWEWRPPEGAPPPDEPTARPSPEPRTRSGRRRRTAPAHSPPLFDAA